MASNIKTPEHGPNADIETWKWVVLAASFFTMLVNAAVSYNVGVLYVAFLENYDASVESVSWMMAVYSAVFALTAPLASSVIELTNCRTCVFLSGLVTCLGWVLSCFVTNPTWFFLTLSIVGLGQSLAQVGGSVGLAFYFPTRTVFASGIALSGNGLGTFLHPALLQILLDSYDLKGAFLILGAVCLNSSTCGLLMRPTSFEVMQHKQKSEHRKSSAHLVNAFQKAYRKYFEILTDLNFIKLVIAVFVFASAYNTALVYLPECLIESKGFSHMEAATIASCVGIGSLISRFLVGFAATESKIGEMLMYNGMNLVAFLVCMAADNLMNYRAGAYFVAFAYGIYASPCVVLFFTLSFYVLGYKKGNHGYGIVLMAYGLASLIGPPIYAQMLQEFGYGALFKITGIAFLLSASVSILIHEPKSSTEDVKDDDTKSIADRYIDAIFGSRNFELIIQEKESKLENNQNGSQCLAGTVKESQDSVEEEKPCSVTEMEARQLLSGHNQLPADEVFA